MITGRERLKTVELASKFSGKVMRERLTHSVTGKTMHFLKFLMSGGAFFWRPETLLSL